MRPSTNTGEFEMTFVAGLQFYSHHLHYYTNAYSIQSGFCISGPIDSLTFALTMHNNANRSPYPLTGPLPGQVRF